MMISLLYPTMETEILTKSLTRSVVEVQDGYGSGGTGFIVEWKGVKYILTNSHVCGGAERKKILHKKKKIGHAEVLIYSKKYDLCLVQLPDRFKPPAVKLADSAALGERVLTLGHPHLGPQIAFSGVLVYRSPTNIVMGRPKDNKCEAPFVKHKSFFGSTCINKMTLVHSTLYIRAGQSGSPVVNHNGDLVGVVVALGGSLIPLTTIRTFLESWD